MSGSRKLFWKKIHVVGPATPKVRRPYTYQAETVEQRVDGGWRNEDAVVQQLEFFELDLHFRLNYTSAKFHVCIYYIATLAC